MNRKHFIQIAGVSLAGLIFNLCMAGTGEPGHLLMVPDEVWIQSGD